MVELGLARVRAATMAALPTNTMTGNVLTAAVNGALPSQDGVALAIADSVLVRQEADARKNGRYVVTSLGSAGTPWVLTRYSEADTSGEARAGMSIQRQ